MYITNQILQVGSTCYCLSVFKKIEILDTDTVLSGQKNQC